MNRVDLYINGMHVDTDSIDSVFSYTLQWDDLTNPSLIKDDYSKTITLPGTPNNDMVFGNIWKLDFNNMLQFNPVQKLEYRLELNGSIWRTGQAKLNTVKRTGSINKYEITLYGGISTLISELNNSDSTDMDNTLLSNLDWPDKLYHILNGNFIIKNWNTQNGDFDTCCRYLRCNNGKYDNFSTDKYLKITDSSGNIAKGTATDIYDGLDFDELAMNELRSYYQRPALYVSKIFKLIKARAEELGYTMNLDIRWFNDENPYYGQIMMMCGLYSQDATLLDGRAYWKADSSIIGYDTSEQTTSFAATLGIPFGESSITRGITTTGGHSIIDIDSAVEDESFTVYTEYEMRFEFVTSTRPDTTNYRYSLDDQDPYGQFNIRGAVSYTGDIISDTKVLYAWPSDLKTFEGRPEVTNWTLGDDNNWHGVFRYNYLKETMPKYQSQTDYEWIPLRHECTVPRDKYQISYYWTTYVTGYQGIMKYRTDEWNSTLKPQGDGTVDGYWIVSCRPVTKRPNLLADADMYYPASYGFTSVPLSIQYSRPIRSGSRVTVSDMVGDDITAAKFLVDYCKMFGLVVSVDDKTITISDKNMYFDGYKIYDWSDKVDRAKEMTITPLLFDNKYVELGLPKNETYYEDKYTDTFGIDFGDVRVNTGYQFGTDTTELFSDVMFTNTVMSKERTQYIYQDSSGNIKRSAPSYAGSMPAYFVKEDDNSRKAADVKFTLVYPMLVTYDSSIYVTDDYLGAEDSSTDPMWLFPQQAKFADSSAASYSKATKYCYKATTTSYNIYPLYFGQPRQVYDSTPDAYKTDKTMYTLFWKNYLSEIYSSANHKLTCYIRLTTLDMLNFSFKNFVVIDNTLYHVNKITDYNPLSDTTTKVELIKVNDINNYLNANTLVIE